MKITISSILGDAHNIKLRSVFIQKASGLEGKGTSSRPRNLHLGFYEGLIVHVSVTPTLNKTQNSQSLSISMNPILHRHYPAREAMLAAARIHLS